jgi:DNA-binding response OmpR family regulator
MNTILVIEDNIVLRSNIVEVLILEDFEVLEADNGKDGVQLLLQHKPDLFLCDIHLPELDGFGVIEAVRANPETASTPFIIMTADPNTSEIVKRLGIKPSMLLSKPFQIGELLTRIRNLLL